MQIATGSALKMLNDYHQESLTSGRAGTETPIEPDPEMKGIITLDDNGD